MLKRVWRRRRDTGGEGHPCWARYWQLGTYKYCAVVDCSRLYLVVEGTVDRLPRDSLVEEVLVRLA
jgi:hypothetical protein